MIEYFRDIKGYEGLYQVSNLGKVVNAKTGRVLKVGLTGQKRNYLLVNLYKNGKAKNSQIHKLVAIAFLNHTPNNRKVVVDHINNIRNDNRLENLQIISQRENSSKDKKNGTSKFTGVNWQKLTRKWRGQIKINNKDTYLGSFSNETEASEIYELALKNIDLYNGNAKEFRLLLQSIK